MGRRFAFGFGDGSNNMIMYIIVAILVVVIGYFGYTMFFTSSTKVPTAPADIISALVPSNPESSLTPPSTLPSSIEIPSAPAAIVSAVVTPSAPAAIVSAVVTPSSLLKTSNVYAIENITNRLIKTSFLSNTANDWTWAGTNTRVLTDNTSTPTNAPSNVMKFQSIIQLQDTSFVAIENTTNYLITSTKLPLSPDPANWFWVGTNTRVLISDTGTPINAPSNVMKFQSIIQLQDTSFVAIEKNSGRLITSPTINPSVWMWAGTNTQVLIGGNNVPSNIPGNTIPFKNIIQLQDTSFVGVNPYSGFLMTSNILSNDVSNWKWLDSTSTPVTLNSDGNINKYPISGNIINFSSILQMPDKTFIGTLTNYRGFYGIISQTSPSLSSVPKDWSWAGNDEIVTYTKNIVNIPSINNINFKNLTYSFE